MAYVEATRSSSEARLSTASSPAVVVREGRGGTPFYEAKWRVDGSQVKRRLGRAWLVRDGEGWRKRAGRTPPGWLDERSAHVAAAEMVAQVALERELAADELARREAVTVRVLAGEWLRWLRDVRGAKPATLRDYAYVLREPGEPHRRGGGRAPGRIMRELGDMGIEEVGVREVSAFLRSLDGELSPRNVNKHRQVLSAMFVYACRADTHALPENPVQGSDKRREPAAAQIDFYEVPEIEALARVAHAGDHRTVSDLPTSAAAQRVKLGAEEIAARAAEDAQDAVLFRVLFYSGMRVGEAVVLRWADVSFAANLQGAMLHVRRSLSDGIEVDTPKGGRARTVPLARPAAQALATLAAREDFTSEQDYVFVNRLGRRLDTSAIRRRYKRACTAAG
ncbi:MAG TPA: tyrosine-type recombinase/integrase, partial [Baekduia sp.]|nr:tyrosine-type recombinase/integrase [Baekduia sp.]